MRPRNNVQQSCVCLRRVQLQSHRHHARQRPRCRMRIENRRLRRTRSPSRCFKRLFFISSRRRHTKCLSYWSSDVCSSDLLTFIHPYDDALVIAGQGTLALEMLGTAPEIDTLVVPIGGGGLISGIAIAAKALKPDIRVIGVQATLYPSMYNVVKSARLPMRGDTLAEGIAVKAPGRLTQRIVRQLVDDIVLVSEEEIEHALSLLINIEKTVVEGAGAAGLAAVLKEPERYKGRILGLVLCGGNIDTRLLASVLTRELAREGRLSQLAIDLGDRPGTLGKVANILGEAGANIVEVYHQRVFCDLPAKGALLEAVIETRDRLHLQETVDRLKAAGFEVEVRSNPGGTR